MHSTNSGIYDSEKLTGNGEDNRKMITSPYGYTEGLKVSWMKEK